jgi:hypothetical protein
MYFSILQLCVILGFKSFVRRLRLQSHCFGRSLLFFIIYICISGGKTGERRYGMNRYWVIRGVVYFNWRDALEAMKG